VDSALRRIVAHKGPTDKISSYAIRAMNNIGRALVEIAKAEASAPLRNAPARYLPQSMQEAADVAMAKLSAAAPSRRTHTSGTGPAAGEAACSDAAVPTGAKSPSRSKR